MAADVQLTVDLEPGDVTKSADELRARIEQIFDATAGKDVSKSFQQMQIQLASAYQSIMNYQAKMEELGRTSIPTDAYKQATQNADSLWKSVEKGVEKTQQLKTKMDAVGSQKLPSDEYLALTKELDRVEKKYNDVYDRKIKFEETGGNKSSRTYKSMIYDLNVLKEQSEGLKHDLQELKQSGKDFKLGTDTTEYSKLSQQYANLTQEVNGLEQSYAQAAQAKRQIELSGNASIAGTETAKYQEYADQLTLANNKTSLLIRKAQEFSEIQLPVDKWEFLKGAISRVGSVIGQVAQRVGSLIKSGLSSFLSAASSAAQKLASSLAQVASNAIRSGMSKLSKSIFGIKGSSESANASIKKGIKLFIKYAFGVRSFFFLYRKIRKAIVEGFQQMAQYPGELNGKISSMLTSLDYFKHAVTTAFAPIVSYVAPILTRFMDLLAKATTSVGQFFASLFGKTSFVRAKKVYHDYAKDLQKSETQRAEKEEEQRKKQEQKEAERLKKQEQKQKEKDKKDQERLKKKLKQYERQLAGFDDVEILKGPDEEDTSSNDTDTTPTTTSSYTPTTGNQKMPWEDPKNMFETVQIEKRFKDLADKIKGFFKNKDWQGLGKFMADGINSAFERIDKTLTSSKVQQRIKDVIDGITETFNSLVDNINWELIGKTFGDGVNLIVDSLNRFYTGIDWLNLGTKIAEGLNSLVKTINWTAIGNLFANKLNATIDFFYGAITEFNWPALGTSLGKAINGFFLKVDWNKLALTLSGLINGIFSGLYNLSTTIKWSEIGAKLGNSLSTLVRTIDWAGIAKSLSTFVSGALDMIISAVEKFDWEGLGDGIGKFLVNIDWLKILTKLLKAIVLIATGLTKTAIALFGKVFTTIFKAIAEETKNKSAQEIITGLFNGIIEALKSVGSWMVENVFRPIIDAFKRAFGISSPSKKMAEQGRYIGQGILSGITSALSGIGSWIKANVFDKIANALNSAFGIVGGVASKVSSVGKSVISGIKSGISSNWEKLSEKLSNIKDKMFKILNKGAWKDIGSNIVDGIESGIRSGWKWLKYTVGDLAESLYEKAKDVLGIQSPSKVFRDQIGKMIPAGVAIGIDGNASTAVQSVEDLANRLTSAATTSVKVPPIVGGQVIPYAVGKSTATDTNTTLKQLIDMLQYNKSNGITIGELEPLLITLFRQYMNIQFRIGDEQIARHANLGNARLDRRFNPSIT